MDKSLSQAVSIEQFAAEIMKQHVGKRQSGKVVMSQHTAEMEAEDFVSYGYDTGWLEESDVLGRYSLLERKTAARIVHQFMRTELKEADEDNTSAAYKLQDLYDCRSCAGHVMQVYVKGIMDGHVDHTGRYIFGMGDTVSVKEMKEIVSRLLRVKQRKVQTQDSEVLQNAEKITAEEVMHYLQSDKKVQLIDVRTNHEFSEKHLEGAKNIPLAAILKNPYMVSDRRDQRIVLYCEEGYKSEIAANCLVDAGYEKVLYFAWKY